MKRFSLLASLMCAFTATGQVSLVKDFSTQASPFNSGSPSYMVTHNNKLYMSATDYEGGVFSSTAIGLFELDDLSGNAKKIYTLKKARTISISSGKNLFFSSTELPSTNQFVMDVDVLYAYNGTSFVAVDTLHAQISKGNGLNAISFGDGRIVYVQNNASTGYELWVSDGTKAGTKLLKDITPGAGSTFSDQDQKGKIGISFKGKIYFAADDNLWVTDGTAAGTELVTNALKINKGYVWNKSDNYFSYVNPGGYAVISDGTASGTKEVRTSEITYSLTQPVENNSSSNLYYIIEKYVEAEGKLVSSLYRTNAGFNDLVLVASNVPRTGYSHLAEFQDKVYTISRGSSSSEYLFQQIDPVTHTITVLKTFKSSALVNFGPFKATSRRLYFQGQDNDGKGNQYWECDGSQAGTNILYSNFLTNGNGLHYESFKDALVFYASDGTSTGYELWATIDGVTSVNDELLPANYSIYPNPARDHIFVRSAEKDADISVYDISGVKVKSVSSTGEQTRVDIEELKNGIYVVLSGSQIYKLVKE